MEMPPKDKPCSGSQNESSLTCADSTAHATPEAQEPPSLDQCSLDAVLRSLSDIADDELFPWFDAYVRNYMKNEMLWLRHQLTRSSQREILFSDLSDTDLDYLEQLAVSDVYQVGGHVFSVNGIRFSLEDELLIEALLELPDDEREIIFLAHVLGLKDREIAAQMRYATRTLNDTRNHALQKLRRHMEGATNDEKNL